MLPDSSRAARFYDDLAADYHLIFSDWKATIQKQGTVLDQVIKREFAPAPETVLDCSCGIGTQALALAIEGYRVHATDISPSSVERLRKEARLAGLSVSTGVADFRCLENEIQGQFDLVISCDNAIPHLITDQELNQAMSSIYSRIRPGGFFLASIRNYDELIKDCPTGTPPTEYFGSEGRRVTFQLWRWASDRKSYEMELFLMKEKAEFWDVFSRTSVYRALKRGEFEKSLKACGFKKIRWHFPEDTEYFQPIVTAHKGS